MSNFQSVSPASQADAPIHERDFVGYGPNPPDPQWPGGKRLAINFVLSYEEGAEASIPDGDDVSEGHLTESPASSFATGVRDLAAESMFEYGSRVGFWRILRLFESHNLPLTIFGCALALERNPEAATAIRTQGLDVCCHGWRWVQHWLLTEQQEREHIQRAKESIARTIGTPPVGWYCRHGPSVHTRRLLAEEGGFLYDSDAYNDELPYWRRVCDKPHLVVPYSLVNNDSKFVRGVFGSSAEFFAFNRDAFDVLYAESERRPTMMSVGLHARIAGHPARAAGLAQFLDYVAKRDDVWICRRVDIARHWHAVHPMTTEHGPR